MCFLENRRFLKNISGFPEIVHFLKMVIFLKIHPFFKKTSISRKKVSRFSSKMMGKSDQNRVSSHTPWNVENDTFVAHPLARSTA